MSPNPNPPGFTQCVLTEINCWETQKRRLFAVFCVCFLGRSVPARSGVALRKGSCRWRVPVPRFAGFGSARKPDRVCSREPRVRDCIQNTLTKWSSKIGQDLNQEILEVLECKADSAIEKINPEERDELKVSAKLFIIGSNSSSIREAVDLACSTLGVAQLDSVIIAPPPVEDGNSLSLEYLQPYWQELENLVQNEKIVAIGTSDLDKTLLEQLYLWAQVKPSSNQVNLASCCVMPPDLTAFAKQFDIQLLTHNDPKELLGEASFQEVLQETIQNMKAHEWIPLWLLRYSVIVKSRGIIKSKGYIVQAKRNAS
ncbi:glutamate-cysteine ligase, modifier subunit [Columba livia]|uniref:Glutamate--cysteine ligase regulatory subunit n=1 Tax=Columba livia TaxID=8932 RepID=A0A2I0MED1_COLLI|nr:glutamate-cysteine ligase, modifier subunit [Columba livia]